MTASTAEVEPAGPTFLTLFPSIMLPMFLAVLDQTIVATALPGIVGDLGEVERTSWIIVSYLVAATIAAPIYGRFGDYFGRRRVMLVALAVFIAASLWCAAASSIPALTAARVLQGLGGGGLMTSSQALIGEALRPRDRARYQGYLAAVAVSANAFGPVAGGYLTQHFGWRSVFLVNLPLGLLAGALLTRLPARRSVASGFHFDALGLGVFVCCVVPALMALQLIQRFDPARLAQTLGLLAVAAVSVALLVRVERRVRAPLIPVALLGQGSIWRCDALAACHGATLVSLLSFLPMYLHVVRGSTISQIGLLLLPLTGGIGIGSLVTGRLVSRTGLTAIFPSVGMSLVAVLLVGFALLAGSLADASLMALLLLISVLMGTVMAVVQVTVQSVAGAAMIGAAAGSVQFSRSIGAALGTSVVSAVLFVALVHADPDAAQQFGHLVELGPGAVATLSPARMGVIRVEVADAFRAAFLAICGFAAVAASLAWTIPLRRL